MNDVYICLFWFVSVTTITITSICRIHEGKSSTNHIQVKFGRSSELSLAQQPLMRHFIEYMAQKCPWDQFLWIYANQNWYSGNHFTTLNLNYLSQTWTNSRSPHKFCQMILEYFQYFVSKNILTSNSYVKNRPSKSRQTFIFKVITIDDFDMNFFMQQLPHSLLCVPPMERTFSKRSLGKLS